MLEQTSLPSRRSLFKWFLFILAIKSVWLVLFTVLRNPEWNPEFSVGAIGLYGGDSQTYYYPVEQLIKTGEYYGMCRMPGVLPVYLPLRMALSEVNAQQAIVILQVIFDSLSSLLLAIMALRIFKSQRAFRLAVLLSCITGFIALRNVYLLSDSLCISSMVTAFFFVTSYLESSQKKHLILAGIFLTWSIFLRQISILAVPVAGLVLLNFHGKNIRSSLSAGALLILPIFLGLSAWTLRNMITYKRPIVLVAPLDECMYNLTPELAAVRTLIIGMGEDFQPWSKGGGAYWFFNQPLSDNATCPFNERHFTHNMSEKEMTELRFNYRSIADTSLSSFQHDSLQQLVIQKANKYLTEYKSEHPFQFHAGNKIRFAALFLFPNRIDDIPFPAMNKMNLLQKGIKVWSLISLWLVHAGALLVAIWWLIKRDLDRLLWATLPLSFIIVLSYLGYIEQRYLATSYPFFLLILAGAISYRKINQAPSALPR